jgi:hypothetical protein
MNDRILNIKNMIEANTALTFPDVALKQSIDGNDCSFLLNGAQYVNLLPNVELYSIAFLYNVKDVVNDNDFDLFLSTIFPNVKICSKEMIEGMRTIHRTITENIDKLALFTENPLRSDSCKGSVTIILDNKTNSFSSITMTGLLECKFKDKSSCFYNIKYTYANINDFCCVLSKNMVSKTLTKFSNNGFICLIDAKMADAFSDIYVDYTKEDLNNIKTLHSMISI